MDGVAFWDWSSNPNAGGTSDTDYTPQGKPAEQVMKQWFTKQGSGNSQGSTPAAPATYSASATAGSQPLVGSPTTISAQVSSSQALSNMLVDIEVYNSQGQKVDQQFYENQNLSSSPSSYSYSWTPPSAGNYTIDVGVFTANWQSNPYWDSSAGSFTAATPAPTPPPAQNNGSGNTSGNQGTPPSNPTPPANQASMSIWWPAGNVPVSGLQPFKALLNGVSLNSYTMYWQVDNGTLNQMSDASEGGDHMEAEVDLSGWNWNPNNQYTVTFVAKDLNGNVIATQSVVITVTH